MKKKSVFNQIILLVIVAAICIVTTVVLAFVAGNAGGNLFDFSNLNLLNMIPVFLIGMFVSGIVVGIIFLFISRSAFYEVRDYLKNQYDKENK